jgi:hypothetical protein
MPKASNKRDQPESSPGHSSPSTQHLDKQARLSAFGSPLISESVTSNTVSTDQVLLSDHFGFYFEFPEELMHLCCAGWFLDEVAYIYQLF